MSESEYQNKYPIVPPGELRCVWMTAGVVSYQLCERKLDCEQCPLDIALRQRFINEQAMHMKDERKAETQESEERLGNLLYGKRHMWVRTGGDHTVRMGIEPGMASVLLSPKAVVLPAVGERVVQNKVCAWIVIEGGTLPIVSPLSGKVYMTNAQLAENPHAVCTSPLSKGWLFEIVPDGPVVEDKNLLSVADAARVYAEDERRFQALLSAELTKGGAVVGQTLADGGQALENLSEMLGPAKYFKLVRMVYS